MLPRQVAQTALNTAEAFGYEWVNYGTDSPYTVEQFLDWISPLGPEFFRGKVVVDAGCGTGAFAAYTADFGARAVLALDLSDSVQVAARHARRRPNLHVIQGSIEAPPISKEMDFVFSIGVIHHLDSPASGIRSLSGLLREGGDLFIWVYGRENNELLLSVLEPVRRVVRRLPFPLLKWGVAAPLAAVLHPVLRCGYRAEQRRGLPYFPYLHWLAQSSFSFQHGVILDQLIAPTAYYMRREEVEEALRSAGLVDAVLSQRNGNSWRARATRPAHHPRVLREAPP